MERLVLDIQNKQYLHSLLTLIKESGLAKGVKTNEKKVVVENILPLTPADTSVNPDELFGIWKGRNLTKERLRNIAWGGRA